MTRCAIYTRKSHEEGLDQEFNSLDAQRKSAEAYIQSQSHEGWVCLPDRYDDGGFSGGTTDRPALKRLLADIDAGKVDAVVVYKVDRLSRSLLDFAGMVERFNRHQVALVSTTQLINSASSMGKLILNVLLSFAQFEREITGDRIRDKKLLTARQGKYVGGQPKLGLDIVDRRYVVNQEEAKTVVRIFKLLLEFKSCRKVAAQLNAEGIARKRYTTKTGKLLGGGKWNPRSVYDVLTDRKYVGKIVHKGVAYDADHPAIVSSDLFAKVQQTLADNKTYAHVHQAQRFALLRRMLTCGHCGSSILPAWTKNHGRQYRYYVCSRRMKTGYDNCPLPSIPAAELERVVVDQLRDVFRQPEIIAAAIKQIASRSTASLALETVQSALQRLDSVWEVLYPEEQRRILELLVESITVSQAEVSLRLRFHGIEQIVDEVA